VPSRFAQKGRDVADESGFVGEPLCVDGNDSVVESVNARLVAIANLKCVAVVEVVVVEVVAWENGKRTKTKVSRAAIMTNSSKSSHFQDEPYVATETVLA
jgi:hypothetical protein